jgi:hypothetical protein
VSGPEAIAPNVSLTLIAKSYDCSRIRPDSDIEISLVNPQGIDAVAAIEGSAAIDVE